MPRSPAQRVTRRAAGGLVLVALAAIALGVTGVELPRSGAEPPLPGVRVRSMAVALRSGQNAPAGELAFLAVESSGTLLVTDRQRRSVLRVDPGGRLLGEWGPQLGPGVTLAEPAGVAAYGDRVYVVDRGDLRLLRLDTAGRLQSVVPLSPYAPYGLNGVAVDPSGNVYVADTGRNRLLVFSPEGQLVRELGRGGSAPGQFTQPWSMVFSPDGALFVADWENARIQRWDRSFTPTDAWPTGYRPSGVAVDGLGRVYVPDADRRRVEVFSPHGAQLGELGGQGTPPIDLAAPSQVAFGPQADALYVLGRNGVVRLSLEDTAAARPAGGEGFFSLESLAAIGLVAAVGALILARQQRRARAPTSGSAEPQAG